MRILKHPQKVTREFVQRVTIRNNIRKRLKGLLAPDSDLWGRVEYAKQAALGFLEELRDDERKVFEYRYSPACSSPTLYASSYACLILSLLGELPRLTERERLEWLSYFDSFQYKKDGLFYDPAIASELFDNTDWWGARHLALHMIDAYTALNRAPKFPFRFLEPYYDNDRLRAWLDEVDWNSSFDHGNDIDNKIMNIGCLLQYQRDTWDDRKAASAVSYLQQYLKQRINPDTGMWGSWNLRKPHQLSRMVQFAYHLFPLFLYDKKEIEHPQKIVSLVLQTQNSFGGFSPIANSSACEDIDSIDILCRLAVLVPERKNEVDQALRKALIWVLSNQVESGGFVFRLNESFTYGHQQMSCGVNQGALFPTWFRLLSIAYLARYFDEERFAIGSAPGLEY